MTIKDNEFETTDLCHAAYCLYKGLELAGKQILGSKSKLFFKGEGASKVAMSYFRSDEKKIMEAYKTVKDFAYRLREESSY